MGVIERLNPHLPAGSYEVDRELSALLLALDAPGAVAKTMQLLQKTNIPREQIAYAYNLRPIKNGWTPELRKAYFEWYLVAANYKGGNSLVPFIRNMKTEAVANLTEEEKKDLAEVLNAKPTTIKPVETKPRPFVKEWTIQELLPVVQSGLKQRDYSNGRNLFTAARCAQCHHFDGDGGPFGPDLTGVAGRFSVPDLVEKLVNPNKTVADLYQSTVLNLKNGKQLSGRIISEQSGKIQIITDPNKLDQITTVDEKDIESREVSKTSFMPVGLLNTLNKEEILDLVAYLLSGGDRGYPGFK